MTGYNIELRIKINRRWEELENQVSKNSPNLSRMDILQLALEAAWIKVIGRKFALSEYPDMLTLNKTCVAIKAQLVESY